MKFYRNISVFQVPLMYKLDIVICIQIEIEIEKAK